MSIIYIDACNSVLRRLNEVEIAPADFATVRGVQSLVKDAVRNSLAKINQQEFEWPFNAAEHTITLVKGQEEYAWPADLKIVDWNSFQLQGDAGLGVTYRRLNQIDRDEWYKESRDADYESGTDGRGIPFNVFPSHGTGFGVTPSPDKAYEIRFRYFQNYTILVNSSDSTRIPEAFDHVLTDGAMFYLYMFKDNIESAKMSWESFKDGLKHLQSIYINTFHSVTDTRTRAGLGGRTQGNSMVKNA